MLATFLRSASGNLDPAVSFVAGVRLPNETSDGVRSLTLDYGFRSGDLLVAMTGARSATPATLAGYTSIVSGSMQTVFLPRQTRSFRVQSKIAISTSETITWTGASGYLIAFRNFTAIGKTGTVQSTTNATTHPLPDLVDLDTSGVGFILAGGYLTGLSYTATSP
jgi:hypothetical protein